MRSLSLALCGLALCLSTLADDKPAAKESPAKASFQRFAKLEGAWVGKMGDKEVHFTYQVVANGSAVMETIGDACVDQMITMYTVDKDELVLTHYCVMGNQPHMKADPSTDANVVSFTCVGGGNLQDEKVPHMHKAKYTFTDADHITAAWTLFADGKDAGVHEFALSRVKK